MVYSDTIPNQWCLFADQVCVSLHIYCCNKVNSKVYRYDIIVYGGIKFFRFGDVFKFVYKFPYLGIGLNFAVSLSKYGDVLVTYQSHMMKWSVTYLSHLLKWSVTYHSHLLKWSVTYQSHILKWSGTYQSHLLKWSVT
jgi:hypothetical protein